VHQFWAIPEEEGDFAGKLVVAEVEGNLRRLRRREEEEEGRRREDEQGGAGRKPYQVWALAEVH
jgi:hypothetical protein